MTTLQPAPDAVIYLVKCCCVKERCSTNRCQCRKGGLNCTDLCCCNDDDEDPCDNFASMNDENDEEHHSDEDEENEEEDDGGPTE